MSKEPNNSPLVPLAIGFFIGAITVGTLVLVRNHDREPPRYSMAPVTVASDPSAPPPIGSSSLSHLAPTPVPGPDPAVARVAAQFTRSCGSCGERRLDVCSCDTAQQERAFLQDQLRSGRSEAEAAKALNEKTAGSNRGRRDRMAN